MNAKVVSDHVQEFFKKWKEWMDGDKDRTAPFAALDKLLTKFGPTDLSRLSQAISQANLPRVVVVYKPGNIHIVDRAAARREREQRKARTTKNSCPS